MPTLEEAQLAQLQADTEAAVARSRESDARAQAQQAQAKLDEARTVVELDRGGWDKAQVVLTQAKAIIKLLSYTTAYSPDAIVAAVTANNLSKLLDHTDGLPSQTEDPKNKTLIQ